MVKKSVLVISVIMLLILGFSVFVKASDPHALEAKLVSGFVFGQEHKEAMYGDNVFDNYEYGSGAWNGVFRREEGNYHIYQAFIIIKNNELSEEGLATRNIANAEIKLQSSVPFDQNSFVGVVQINEFGQPVERIQLSHGVDYEITFTEAMIGSEPVYLATIKILRTSGINDYEYAFLFNVGGAGSFQTSNVRLTYRDENGNYIPELVVVASGSFLEADEEETTTAGGEEETTTAGGEEETTTAGGEEETTTSGGEEETTTSGGEEETTTSGGEEETTTSGSEEETTAGGEEETTTSGSEEETTAGGEEETTTSGSEEETTTAAEESTTATPETTAGGTSSGGSGGGSGGGSVRPHTPVSTTAAAVTSTEQSSNVETETATMVGDVNNTNITDNEGLVKSDNIGNHVVGNPQTSDSQNILILIVLIVVSGSTIYIICNKKRGKANNQ